MAKVHQASIDTYLEDIVLSAIERTADAQARKEIQELAFKIDSIAHELEHRFLEGDGDGVIETRFFCLGIKSMMICIYYYFFYV